MPKTAPQTDTQEDPQVTIDTLQGEVMKMQKQIRDLQAAQSKPAEPRRRAIRFDRPDPSERFITKVAAWDAERLKWCEATDDKPPGSWYIAGTIELIELAGAGEAPVRACRILAEVGLYMLRIAVRRRLDGTTPNDNIGYTLSLLAPAVDGYRLDEDDKLTHRDSANLREIAAALRAAVDGDSCPAQAFIGKKMLPVS